MNRAHRLERPNPDKYFQKRPIIVNFRDYGDVKEIMGVVYKLRNTPFSIDYDMPKEIQNARKRLWPKYKQCKSDRPS